MKALSNGGINAVVTKMKKMKINYLFALGLIVLAAACAVAQQPSSCGTSNDVRVVKDKPTIYITFERFGKALNPDEQKMLQGDQRKKVPDNGSDVWLRIHNNTCWSINFEQYGIYLPKPKTGETMKDVLLKRAGILEDGIETSLYYSIMKGNEQIGYTGIDVVDTVTLPAGLTVLFSVDKKHLAPKQSVRLSFHYAWEYKHGNEPEHYLEFSDYDLKEQSEPE